MLTLEQRLLSKIEKQDRPDGCWIWRGSTKKGGYGQISVAGYQLTTHRVAFELWVARTPEGLSVMHTCNNPRCCNPAHLCVGTNKQNVQYSGACGRRAKLNNAAKLRPCDAAEIKWLALNTDKTQDAIGKLYAVDARTVSDIKKGGTWAHIEPEAPREAHMGEVLEEVLKTTLSKSH